MDIPNRLYYEIILSITIDVLVFFRGRASKSAKLSQGRQFFDSFIVKQGVENFKFYSLIVVQITGNFT